MSAALCALHESIKQDPVPYKNLIPSFISILKQACPSFKRHLVLPVALDCDAVRCHSGTDNVIACDDYGAPSVQVAEHRLPKAYDYHRSPAPFIQACASRLFPDQTCHVHHRMHSHICRIKIVGCVSLPAWTAAC